MNSLKTFSFIFCMVVANCTLSYAQTSYVQIEGPAAVNTYQQTTYNVAFYTSWGAPVIDPPSIDMASWNTSIGTNNEISRTNYSITIQWTQPGTYNIEYDFYGTEGEHFYDDFSITVTSTGPSAPVATAATSITGNSFTANWNSVSGATSYRLDVSQNSSFTNILANYNNLSVSGTNRSVAGLAPGVNYYYRVRAVNSGGTSLNSNVITATTIIPPPSAPVATSATSITSNSFVANWNSVSGANSYRLDVSTNSSFSSFVSGYNNLSVTTTSRNVFGLSPGTTYYYRVRAVNTGGTSANSNTITATTSPPPPPAPVAIAATSRTTNSFTANWNSVSGATSYRLDVSTTSNFSGIVAGYNNLSVSSTSRSVTGLTPGTTYYYRVRAVNSSGPSSNSNTITTSTNVAPPSTPVATAATNVTTNSFTANWNAVGGATSYRLDVSTNSIFSNFVSGYNNLSVSATSRNVTGLTPGVTHYYRVRAVNSSGTSSNSNTISLTTIPATYVQIDGPTTVELYDQTSYNANFYVSGGIPANDPPVMDMASWNTSIGTSNEISRSDNAITIQWTHPGTYHLEYDFYTTENEHYFAEKDVTVISSGPSAPVATSATNIANESFTANWNSVSGATGYRLDVSTNSIFTNLLSDYNNLSLTSTNRNVTGLAPGTTYYYRVRAINSSGVSLNSNVVSVATTSTPPPAPVAKTATVVTDSRFEANWESVTGASGYRLDVSHNSNFTNILPGYNNISVSGTKQVVTGLGPNLNYYYRVRAVNSAGPSVNSNTITVTTFPSQEYYIQIDGPTSVGLYEEVTYNAQFYTSTGGTVIDLPPLDMAEWSIAGESDSDYSITIQWTEAGTYTLVYDYYTLDGDHYHGSVDVSVINMGPSAPIASLATNVTNNSFTANWNSVSGAASYRLDVSTDNFFSDIVDGYNNLPVSATNKSVIGLEQGTTYYFRVRAINGGGHSSANSNHVKVDPISPPKAPLALSAVGIKAREFRALWETVSGASDYVLDVSTNANFTSFVPNYNNRTVSGTSATVFLLQPNTTYHYRLRAVNAVGPSQNSNVITVTTASAPNAPVAMSPTNIASTSFTANWSSVPEADNYLLDVSTSSGFEHFVPGFGNVSVNGTSKEVTGLVGGISYYYRIRAENQNGLSVNSNVMSLTTVTAVPIAPEVRDATDITESSFIANWHGVINAANYRLDVSTTKDFTSFVSGYHNLLVLGTSQEVTGLVEKASYYYRVRAVNAAGTSPNSHRVLAMSLDENYIRSIDITAPGIITMTQVENASISQKNTQYVFYDGLGRPKQSVAMMASPQQKDVVLPIAYDEYGRENIKYLPYASTEDDGWLKPGFVDKDDPGYAASPHYQFYQSASNIAHDPKPFAETVLEPSPLSRPLEQGAPGEAWQPGTGHTIRHSYQTNAANEVVLWKINSSGGLAISSDQAFYGPVQFYKNITTDEEGNKVIEYTDKQGQTILKKVQLAENPAETSHEGWACTYYVYDDFGNLTFVLPPQLVEEIRSNFSSGYSPTVALMDQYAFLYKYDYRNRMREKKVPGAEPVYIVYDKRDRMVLTQDGNQRSTEFGGNSGKEWTFTKYDAMNRPVMTGIYTHTGPEISQEDMQDYVNDLNIGTSAYAWHETLSGSGDHGYNNGSFPKTDLEVLSVTYYDNYSFRGAGYFGGGDASFNYDNGVFNGSDFPTAENQQIKGQVTGSKVKVLDPNGSVNYLKTIIYYDNRYRVVQTITENQLGGKEKVSNYYDDLTANVKESSSTSTAPEALTVHRIFSYDHAQRLQEIQHQVNQEAPVTIVSNQYNELGELISKDLNKTGESMSWQTVDYHYNIRGWLTSINDANLSDNSDLFGMELYYNDGFDIPYYNGNISGVKWKTAVDEDRMAYGYHYDKLNRITNAHYVKGTSSNWEDEGFFNMEILPQGSNPSGYDLNGNILNLKRYGLSDGNPAAIDVLSYEYTGNRLNKVEDAGTEEGFKDGANPGNDYEYDANGNMIIDRNKGIENIEYNYMNLPMVISMTEGRKIEYIYDAAGIKLAQRVYEDDTQSATRTTDYIGERIYETKANGARELQFIHHEEGRIVYSPPSQGGAGGGYEYQYHLKDHLGNTRLTFGEEKTTQYLLTMEIDPLENRIIEAGDFENVFESEDNKLPQLNHTPISASTPNPVYVAKLNGTDDVFGPAKSIKVLPGDQVEIEAYAKYLHLSTYDPSVAGSALLSGFLGAFINASSEFLVTKGYVDEGLLTGLPIISNGGDDYSGVPQAYINYILFDKEYNVVEGAKLQISETGKFEIGDANLGSHDHLQIDPITVTKEGYIYIYLSNQTSGSEVYFDDLLITHTQSRVTQKDDYYPFGLSIEGLNASRENSMKNNYLYNGKELQTDFAINWLDYGARMYDAELGRWHVIDPLSDIASSYTPYKYALNNPINAIDPDGRYDLYINGQKVHGKTKTYAQNAFGLPKDNADNNNNEQNFRQLKLTKVNPRDEGAAKITINNLREIKSYYRNDPTGSKEISDLEIVDIVDISKNRNILGSIAGVETYSSSYEVDGIEVKVTFMLHDEHLEGKGRTFTKSGPFPKAPQPEKKTPSGGYMSGDVYYDINWNTFLIRVKVPEERVREKGTLETARAVRSNIYNYIVGRSDNL